MVEAIQCPSCQTRYGLRQARVRSGLRRAQCFRCGDVFQIEPEVKRLLAGLESVHTANVPLTVLADAIQAAPARAAHESASDLALSDLELPEPEMESAASLAAPAAESWPSPSDTAPIPSMARAPELPMPELVMPMPELDLPEPGPVATGSMAEFELPPVPEPATLAAEPSAPQDSEPGTYASAKDAIARLFGDTPLAPSPTANLRSALDMDAGMKALEDTLGGAKGLKVESLSTQPFTAPAAMSAATPAATPMAESELPHASATLRMTASEVASAVGSVTTKAPEPPEITQEEVTMVLPPPPAPAADAVADPSALRLRIGDQLYGGLDLATIAKWIEEGRVLEDHQVARGTSENWMDAVKVPALRAVFERLRRARLGGDVLPPPPPGIPDTGQLKRGLFGGMFGKKE